MNKGLEIVFHSIPHSDAIESNIRKRIQKLERFSDKINGCKVVLDRPHNHHHKGIQYSVSLDLAIPHVNIHVQSGNTGKQAHADLYVAIRDTFSAAQRKLKQANKQQRFNAKHIMAFEKGALLEESPFTL